jgi:hypothetical protein
LLDLFYLINQVDLLIINERFYLGKDELAIDKNTEILVDLLTRSLTLFRKNTIATLKKW